MASLVYGHCIDNLNMTAFNFNETSNNYKAMLVTSTYTPNQDTHEFRTSVTNEVGNSGSYTSGGGATTVTVTKDDANNRSDVTFSSVSFTSATITARAAVIYRDTGAAATDELIAYVDFGSDVSSTNGTFTVTFSSPLRFQY